MNGGKMRTAGANSSMNGSFLPQDWSEQIVDAVLNGVSGTPQRYD